MKVFLSKYQYIIVFIAGLIIVGAAAVLVIQLNGIYLPSGTNPSSDGGPSAAVPVMPAAPSVSLTIQKTGKTTALVVNWTNLPSGTTALNIFRTKSSSSSTAGWSLWKTVSIPAGENGAGSAQFNLTNTDLGYQYYTEAVGGGPGNENNTTSTNVLWTSSSTTPIVTTSTVPISGNSGNNENQNNASSTDQIGTTASSTNTSSTSSNDGDSTSTGTTSVGSGPSGNPFYNPQVQITGYGTERGSFWVEHINQSIEVGWQDLPTSTDKLIFYRSTAENGPWNQFLKQTNPGSTGSYSLEIVDGTLGDPYYYQMIAFQGSVSSATYGPIYLPAAN